jgi:hypothetical protein
MQRHLTSVFLAVTAAVGLVLLLQHSMADVAQYPLTKVPVTGRLPQGGTFQGRLTVQTLAADEFGQLSATGILTGTAVTTPRTATKIPPHTFTVLASLLDLRGTCTTVVLDLQPIFLAPLGQEITLVPIVLGPQDTPQGEHLLHTTLCALARLQD